jgi:NhaA family Na+:H+ antiporter
LYQARQWIGIAHQYSILLIVGVLAALAVANVDQHFYEQLVDYRVFDWLFGNEATVLGHDLTAHFLINEILMVFFFGIAAKEITDSLMPGGALNPVHKAVNPILGTLGGVAGPAGLYLLLTLVFYGGTGDFTTVSNGWAIPTATDIALAWLVARMVFGPRHPAVNFLLLLAVADDGIGLGIIAVFYPDPEIPVMPAWLLLTAAGIGVAFAMRRLRVNSWVPYIAIAGTLSWIGLLRASIEPALALVVIVPFLPSAAGNNGHNSETALTNADALSLRQVAPTSAPAHGPLEQFEHQLKYFVDFVLFFFAFANAGVAFSAINQVTFIVLLSLVAGKTIGITLFSWVAVLIGFPLPTGMGTKHLAVAALIAGLGLTVALFLAGKAFPGPPFQDPAKMGAVLSGGVALLALVAGALLKVRDSRPGPGDS